MACCHALLGIETPCCYQRGVFLCLNPSAPSLCRVTWRRPSARPLPQWAAWRALRLPTALTAWCAARTNATRFLDCWLLLHTCTKPAPLASPSRAIQSPCEIPCAVHMPAYLAEEHTGSVSFSSETSFTSSACSGAGVCGWVTDIQQGAGMDGGPGQCSDNLRCGQGSEPAQQPGPPAEGPLCRHACRGRNLRNGHRHRAIPGALARQREFC